MALKRENTNNKNENEKKTIRDLAEGLYKYLPTTSLLLVLSSAILFYAAYGGNEFWTYFLVFAPAMVANGSAVLWKKVLIKVYYKNKTSEDEINPHYIHEERLGKGKTWEGFLFGASIGILAGIILLALTYALIYRLGYRLGFSYLFYLLVAVLTSFMALIGDIVGSAVKRWRGLERGAPVPILDQIDFYLFASIGLLIAGFPLTLDKWAYFFLFVYGLHVLTNCLAYSRCIKNECP